MNHRTSLSIIIPVYQVEDYIVTCLESVANQEYNGQVEVIIVDDCGTDNSMALAKEFVRQYRGPFSFSIYYHPFNKGLSAARNTGMEHATGDYLLFLDSDDELFPDALNNLAAPLREEQFDVVVGGCETKPGRATFRGSEILSGLAQDRISVVAWSKLYRRQMIVDNSVWFYEGIIHEDELWSFQIAIVANSLHQIKEATYSYRHRRNSIMTTKDVERKVNSLRKTVFEMQALSERYNIVRNEDVTHKIECVRMRVLKEFCQDRDRFVQEYLVFRRANPLKWTDYVRSAGLHPVRQLRLFHYALPPRFGALYHFRWLCRGSR